MLALAFVLCFDGEAYADIISLRTGERLVGKVVVEEAGRILFDSEGLGRLEIPRERVEKLEISPSTAPEAPPPRLAPATNTTGRASASAEIATWFPSPPGERQFDWIQLKSGEWLKGRIKSLQDEKLEFDSEEMDYHEFKWEDIHTVRSPRLNSMRFEHAGQSAKMEGSLLVTTNEVLVFNPTATNAFPRAELLAITPTGAKEVNKWSGKVSAGLNIRSGNTREVEYNAHATLQRRTPSTRLTLDYLGNFGLINGVETENNHRALGQFDYFLSPRLFVRVPDIEYYQDPLQNLAHRLTLGGGVGYDLVKTRRVEWDVSAGAAYQRNWYESVETNETAIVNSVALVVGTRLDLEVTKRLDFILEYRGQFTGREAGDNTHHSVATLEFEIHKRLKLDVSFTWDRISNPKADADGGEPHTDDFRLTTGLGIDF